MRVFLATLNPTIGDLEGSTRLMRALVDDARTQRADLVVFPELAVSGYPPRDLLTHGGFVEACADAARRLGETGTQGITAVFGCPLAVDGVNPKAGIANALVVYRDNGFEACPGGCCPRTTSLTRTGTLSPVRAW
jgi:NAD+ synthase (glutamine-hydrolysing)